MGFRDTPFKMDANLEIFLIVPPGLEHLLASEMEEQNFNVSRIIVGGIESTGTWNDIWRMNLELRGATRILTRLGSFRAMHLAQLDKRARKFDWTAILRRDTPVRIEVTCRKSRIYHAGAAMQRFERALTEAHGIPVQKDARLVLKVRIEDDLCTISLDTSGEPLHKRGHKEFVGKAPLRESMAALLLRACAFNKQEPVVDLMCGSGTYPIEAAEIAANLQPGRNRRFAFETLANFDATAFAGLRRSTQSPVAKVGFGSDRDQGAVSGARANAARAGVDGMCTFERAAVSDARPPDGPPGLVMLNPPYGARIGNRKLLFGLYAKTGDVLRTHFKGWRVGMITSDGGLAKTMDLPFLPLDAPIAHGGLKVQLYRTEALN